MKITFLSDKSSWKNAFITDFAGNLRRRGHQVLHLHDERKVHKGDILFILGFFKIVPGKVLRRNKTSVVVHESALPKGRGWSPVHWLVIEGARSIPLTLFEAVEQVDAGRVYLRGKVDLDGTELLADVRNKVGRQMMALCRRFVSRYPAILKRGVPQKGKPTYYRRRGPEDSRLDAKKSIAEQFNLLRVVDNDEYPAFFTYRGLTYRLTIERH